MRRSQGKSAPRPDEPLVLAIRQGNRRVVFAANAAAEALGVRRGVTLAKANALIDGLIVQEADVREDARALERLALWMVRRYSPIVGIDAPDGLVLDSTGVDHLFGGETRLLEDMRARLGDFGLSARAACADTRGAAFALARCGSSPLTTAPPGSTKEALRPLPLHALRLDDKTVETLQVLGFETIGDLLDRPRTPLARRFGPDFSLRIDQALGAVIEPIAAVRPVENIRVERVFAEPISAAETIARYVTMLAQDLCVALEAKGRGARVVDLACHRVDSQAQRVRVRMAQPVRDPVRLARLLCDRIETIDPGFGVETMTLSAAVAEPLACVQKVSALGGEEATADVSALIDVLSNRLGAERLYRMRPVASDVPERSVTHAPPLDSAHGATFSSSLLTSSRSTSQSSASSASWPLSWPRPPRLLDRPEPIEALSLLPDYPPRAFTWRGRRRSVRCADGPERIYGEWWKSDEEIDAVRDYYRLEAEDGQRFWVFRSGRGDGETDMVWRWWMHGFFG